MSGSATLAESRVTKTFRRSDQCVYHNARSAKLLWKRTARPRAHTRVSVQRVRPKTYGGP